MQTKMVEAQALALAFAHKPLRVPEVFWDFKDMVYPFFESDTLFLECLFVLFLFIDSSNRGMSKQYLLTVFFESLRSSGTATCRARSPPAEATGAGGAARYIIYVCIYIYIYIHIYR